MISDLTELIKAYVAAEPNRARGGIVALNGFEYQVWSYLADFTESLASGDVVSGGLQFTNAFETLSDHTRGSGANTVCVQVKQHLDRSTMSLAAAEFAAVERFCQLHGPPELKGAVQYELIARTGSAADWSEIQLPGEIRTREPDLSNYFQKLREDERLLEPRLEPDPQWRLIATVYTRLTNPFDFARRSFELCMKRSREAGSAAFIRGAIAEDYAVNLRRRSHVDSALTPADFGRYAHGSGISLAKTPTLNDLRCGRFMERSKLVSDVLAVLEQLTNVERDRGGPTVPVLWIDGRSGCGKSVLLLQLMERLVIEKNASVIWFANGSEEFSAALEQIVNSSDDLGPNFLVVDDIYDPQARDDLDLPRLTRLVVHSSRTKWPILLTCGPTEFRQDFERDSRAEGFRVTPWHLRTLEPTETKELRHWFQGRTGRLPDPGSASTEQHALMLSVLFELEHGDLRPFANRFRSRLVRDQLDTVLSVPLALNRLYIWTPRKWLSPDEQGLLERLNQDGDFSILSLEKRGEDLFKVTHPHLSNAIYRALHPEEIPVTFSRHLVTAFSRALGSHLPTALRLLRTASSQPFRLEIVDDAELAAGMSTAWNAWDKADLSRSMAAEAWVAWAKWAARDPSIATLLHVSPLATAIGALESSHSRWPMLWSVLWSCAPGEPLLIDAALEWLASHFDVDGWYQVWWRVAQHSVQYAREMNIVSEAFMTLCQLGSHWLTVSSHLIGWGRVWEQLIDAPELLPNGLYDELVRKGLAWIREYQQNGAWNFVWEKLATISRERGSIISRKNVHELGFQWLKEQPNHPGWPFVWQYFMGLSPMPAHITPGQLFDMALEWSSERENDSGWIFVITRLAAAGTSDVRVKTFEGLVAWLEQHPSFSRWHTAWYQLFHLQGNELTSAQRRRLFKAAVKWVAADDEREHVLFVLTHLIRNLYLFTDAVDEVGLVNTACDALTRTVGGDDGEWVQLRVSLDQYVRESPILASSTMGETLRNLGRRWLNKPEHLNQGHWSQVYKHVYRTRTDDDGIHRALAIRGVVQGLIHDSPTFVAHIYSTPTSGPPPDELIAWLDQWFSGPAKDSGGFSVWMRLYRAANNALGQRNDNQWMKLKHVLDRHHPERLSRWETVVEHYRQHKPIVGRVMKTVLVKGGRNRPSRLGYVVDVGTNAFLTVENAGLEHPSDSARLALVGQVLEFDIIRLDEIKLQVDLARHVKSLT